MTFRIKRPPQDDDELWWFVSTLFGLDIPRKAVCREHVAPFEAFADAYFARSPISIWKASRGFGGKTTQLGALALTEAATLGAGITILGGSSAQSFRVYEVVHEALAQPAAPKMLSKEPTRTDTRFVNGGRITALMASQRSVRGPHPQRLRLDEIDEMDLDIFDAAMGQPMESPTVPAQTVASSTHQYPDKTMSEILTRAKDKGWPVFTWCYKESAQPHGWLTQAEMDRKRHEVSRAMWEIEYDLQEPSFEGRAIDPEKVEIAFSGELGHFDGRPGEYIEIMPPQLDPRTRRPLRTYVTGVDWAKTKDWTVIRTYDATDEPWVEIAFERLGRVPWPDMVERLNIRLHRFPGLGAHDATGLGSVVADLVEHDVTDVVMAGRFRASLFSDYIGAIEREEIIGPRIDYAYTEHKYLTLDDLYKPSGHPPDSFVAGAIAWSIRDKTVRYLIPPLVDAFERDSPWTNM